MIFLSCASSFKHGLRLMTRVSCKKARQYASGIALPFPFLLSGALICRSRTAGAGSIHQIIRTCSDEAIRARFCSPESDLHRMDNETFHLTLAGMLEDDRLMHIMENLMAVVIFTYAATPFYSSEEDIGNQHEALIQAILDRDEPRAQRILREDLQYSEE